MSITKINSGIKIIAKNNQTTSDRTAEIVVSGKKNEVTKTISVSQKGLSEVTGPEKSYIYYTSVNGRVITPSNTNYFDANIVSNTYENGQGVIAFDAPMWTLTIDDKSCTRIAVEDREYDKVSRIFEIFKKF